MKVLVASDGGLPVDPAADLAVSLAGGDDPVVLFTAVEIPRSFLESLRAAYDETTTTERVDTDAEYVQAAATGHRLSSAWPGDDVFIERYVSDTTHRRLDDLAEAIRTRGGEVELAGVESEDPAHAVLVAVEEHGADVLCIGSHGTGRFEGLVGSVGTKLVRRSPVSVLMVKA